MATQVENVEAILEKNLSGEDLNAVWRILYGEDHPEG